MHDINQIVYNFLNNSEEKNKTKNKDEIVIKMDGNSVRYPRKKKKLKQKDVFEGNV